MDFLYAAVIVSLWVCEALIGYHAIKYVDEKRAERATGKKEMPKWLKEAIDGLIVIPLGIGLLALPIWVISSITNHAQDQLQDRQWANCANARTVDGKYLTKNQCEYFRDVLDGKYTEITDDLRRFEE